MKGREGHNQRKKVLAGARLAGGEGWILSGRGAMFDGPYLGPYLAVFVTA